MTLTRFTPFRGGLNDVAVLQNRLNSIFQDFTKSEAGLGIAGGRKLCPGGGCV